MEQNTHWNGKLCYAYGTSLTSVTMGKMIPWLAQLSGLKIVNKGLPGEGITHLGGHSTGKVKEAILCVDDGKTEADLILLEVGANEGGAIGDIFDIGNDSFCGCLNQCLRYLLQHTNAQIVVYPSTIPTSAPETRKDYYQRLLCAEAVSKINRVYFLGHADGLGQSRISKDDRFVSDQIHQTLLGGYNRALSIWYQLQQVPLFVPELPKDLPLPKSNNNNQFEG